VQKKLNGKLVLSKETLRTLTQNEIHDVKGGQTDDSICSNPTYTDTCFACSRRVAC
jgi:hypothetical protein